MNRTHMTSSGSVPECPGAPTTARHGGDDGLDLGRLVVTRSVFGQMEVYKKKDGTFGASFDVAQSIVRYGVTRSVRQRFPELGAYDGWAFVDSGRAIVFRFLAGQAKFEPACHVAIETSDGRVAVPPWVSRGVSLTDGTWVGFRWRPGKVRGEGKARREATQILPLGGKHLSVIGRLVTEGKLVFSRHAEVFHVFFKSLPALDGTARQDLGVLDAALAKLGADSSVPAEFQMLARVERTKLSAMLAPEGGKAVTQESDDATKKRGIASKPVQAADASAKSTVPTDVLHVKLQLD